VALQYLASWLAGVGAAGINNLMEDAATAEISRAQLWQWIRNGTRLVDGRTMTREVYSAVRDEEVKRLGALPHLDAGVRLLDGLVLASDFTEFLTIPAYRELDRAQGG
jgi:malate synthase